MLLIFTHLTQIYHLPAIHDVTNDHIETHVTKATILLAGELARTEEPAQSEVMHRHLSRLVHNILGDPNDESRNAACLIRGRSPYPTKRHDMLSKLLSAADSLDIISEQLPRRSTMSEWSNEDLIIYNSSGDIPAFNNNTACTQTPTTLKTVTETTTTMMLPPRSNRTIPIRTSTVMTDTQTQCDLDSHPRAMMGRESRPITTQNLIRLHDNDEYMRSLQSVPPYMRSPPSRARTFVKLWDYRVTDHAEWQYLINKVDAWADLNEKHVHMSDKSTATTVELSAKRRRTFASTPVDGLNQRRTTTQSSAQPRETGTPSLMTRNLRSCFLDDYYEDADPEDLNAAFKERKRAKTILRLDRRTDGRWNGVTVAKLLTRMEEDSDITKLLEKKIAL